MQITQLDIDYTVKLWANVWVQQGKEYRDGVIYDKKDDRVAIPIETFINNFVSIGTIFTWKAEMEKFRREAMEQLAVDRKQDFAIKSYFASMKKIDWEKLELIDTSHCKHKYVMMSDTQVITESDSSFFVWDKSTGTSLMKDCEELELLNLK